MCITEGVKEAERTDDFFFLQEHNRCCQKNAKNQTIISKMLRMTSERTNVCAPIKAINKKYKMVLKFSNLIGKKVMINFR